MSESGPKLGVVFFPAFDWAISDLHPEREERLLYTQDQFREEGIFDIPNIQEHPPTYGLYEDVERVHFCLPETRARCGPSHLSSLGGAVKAADLVFSGQADKALALVRPPGHHAMKVVHGNRGFCDVNITAMMIEYARETYGAPRVAVVDTDCHASDGIMDIYWNDPDTLVISLHQDPRTAYPGTGYAHELGGPTALGATVNIPLPPGTGDAGYIYAIENVVKPLLAKFKPDLVVNAAGQDSHFSDPLTDMNMTARGYAEITRRLKADIAVLEGGYAIHGALPYTNLSVALAMAGVDYSGVAEPDLSPAVIRAAKYLSDDVRRVCDTVLENLANPPAKSLRGDFLDGWYTWNKDIYYDTDGISESQIESVRLCNECSGLVRIETWSTAHPLSCCLEVPRGACLQCQSLGQELYETAKKQPNYRYVRLIDRVQKKNRNSGF